MHQLPAQFLFGTADVERVPKKQHTIPVADWKRPERSLTPAKVRAAVDVPQRRSSMAIPGSRLFVIDAQLGTLGFEAARERLAELGELPEDQARTAGQLLTSLEVDAVLEEHGRSAETARRFIAMHDAGRLPSGPAAVDFWLNILYYLRGTEDERYSAMVEAMAKAAERDPELEPYLRRFR